MASGDFGGGDGTEKNPFLVEDAWDLDAVRNHRYSYFKQTKDIDLSVIKQWIPICGNADYDGKAFCGVYDGDNKKVKNLKFMYERNKPAEENHIYDIKGVGLFGVIYDCHLKNIQLENVYVTGYGYMGSLVGLLHNVNERQERDKGYRYKTIIENCHMLSGTVVGGAISSAYYPFTPQKHDGNTAGGLIGYIGHGWNYHYNNEEVVIKKCSAKGIIRGGASRGGFIGAIYTDGDTIIKISDCFSNVIHENYVVDPTENIRSQYDIGGFLGYSHIYSSDCTFEVKNCYSVDDRSSINQTYNDTSYWGGFASSNDDYENEETLIIKSNYYDSMNGFTDTRLAEPKTTAEMKRQETFIDWDFNSTWGININETYPYFVYVEQSRIQCKSFNLTDI